MCLDRVFINQALNTLLNYGARSFAYAADNSTSIASIKLPPISFVVTPHSARETVERSDLYVTDPPYADAINYHEITEYFIAWVRRGAPAPFSSWAWSSRRSAAIKGKDETFRREMVAAYAAMTQHSRTTACRW